MGDCSHQLSDILGQAVDLECGLFFLLGRSKEVDYRYLHRPPATISFGSKTARAEHATSYGTKLQLATNTP
jgi:hypothetical protein